MKKSIKFLVAALLIVSCLGVFAACKKHKTHTYGTEWKYDAAQHWHECTGKGCAEKSGAAGHGFTYTKTATQHTEKCSTCGYSKGAVNHTLGYGIGGAKAWEQSCVCGHKTGESDYTKMSLAQFFAEMTNNEGNYIVDVDCNEGGAGDKIWHWEVNGKISYSHETDSANSYMNRHYTTVIRADMTVYSYKSNAHVSWNIDVRYGVNEWLSGDGCIFTDDYIDEGYGITANDFKADGANTYVLKTPQDIWGDENAACEITFGKDSIVMEIVCEGVTFTYTITLGNSTLKLPQEVQDYVDTVMMFGIAPTEFEKLGNAFVWYFECADITEGGTIIDKILIKIGSEYEKGEKQTPVDSWGYVCVRVIYYTELDMYWIEFNDDLWGANSESYGFYLEIPDEIINK